MTDFVRVLGEDPYYKGRKTYVWISIHSVCSVCPVYAVTGKDGSYWRCADEHPGAVVVSYLLTDLSGRTYSCGNPRELETLGVVKARATGAIGFLSEEGGERIQIELTESASAGKESCGVRGT